MLKLLFIGDVVGQPGCEYLRRQLPALKRSLGVEVTIVNGENSAVGNGILPSSANFLLDSGADVITTGNHVFKRREIYDYLEENPQVIRPANFPARSPGQGYYVYDGGSFTLCVVNMMGVTYMEPLSNPFYEIDRILDEVKADYYFVDFHAEATGEKKAFGCYLDGRVSGVIGTHTHVQTADEQILPGGTGFLSDAGMTGPAYSALGVNPKNVIDRYLTAMPTRFEVEDIACQMNGVYLEIEKNTGKCTKISRINIK
ncbi:TIGR00282 family metallophosphoesterase [Massilimaliae timonensis]|uniref:TIGR00282 family metallophosphoesterase n=1 Tax=Massiliimalia timonensis TaxID=1987501 RepID=A0A8J6P730_9FIRM|nr:TIGR00282 family metallophosphoesterase [Massiliimalia timonensis]MBC8610574.1 TIGR00282 family metallophosphoesterase [Massiliimalia timonensis]